MHKSLLCSLRSQVLKRKEGVNKYPVYNVNTQWTETEHPQINLFYSKLGF